jgi:lysophospholipase L1-like esterase
MMFFLIKSGKSLKIRLGLKKQNWAILSLTMNGVFLLTLAYNGLKTGLFSDRSLANSPHQTIQLLSSISDPEFTTKLGERHQLNYQQWVALLQQEAKFIAEKQPENLNILLGDSISLWFPPEMLTPQKTWLNQGISGETSRGLLRRLELLDETKPQVIFIMIGINDLLREVKDDTIIVNQILIIRYLRRVHPEAKIVIQSILPHSAENATWEGKDRLLKIPNQRIQKLNHRLAKLATAEGVLYLDLYPLFADEKGNLKLNLTTDGLHLAPEGYKLWSIALEVYRQLALENHKD